MVLFTVCIVFGAIAVLSRITGQQVLYAGVEDSSKAEAETRDTELSDLADLMRRSDPDGNITKESPTWPIAKFLEGELGLTQRDTSLAVGAYQELIDWALENSQNDQRGRIGLAVVAIWRQLRILKNSATVDRNQVELIIKETCQLLETRLTRGIFKDHLLTTLPQMEEDILRSLAVLAWKTGLREEAQRFFLDYLNVASEAELSPAETIIWNHLISSGYATYDRLVLLRGKRLHSLKRFDAALSFLNQARLSNSPQVRAEAGFYRADIMRTRNAPGSATLAVLNSVIEDATDPDLTQMALFERAKITVGEGGVKNNERFLEDLRRIYDEYPNGKLADDALYETARYYQRVGDIEKSLGYFEQLRNFKGDNDWFNLSYFQPAIALDTNGRPGDINRARLLLEELNARNRYGPAYLASLFWLARIAEEGGDSTLSRELFDSIIATSPYDYYGIRARMHKNMGSAATASFWPDPVTAAGLQREFQVSTIDTSISGDSPYHIRIREAVRDGLYSRVLKVDSLLRERFPSTRLEAISLDELDEAGAIASLAILMSLRRDARVAARISRDPRDRLEIAGAVGQLAGDWSLSMTLIGTGISDLRRSSVVQNDSRFPATSYPAAFHDLIENAGREYNVMPELLYGIIKRQSAFNPWALSTRNACGLFQFIPETFDSLDARWGLLASHHIDSRNTYLVNPGLNISLGARWFKEELLDRHQENIFFAILEHVAGYPSVRVWRSSWRELGRIDDIEYMVETIRYAETRIFARDVYANMILARMSGMFSQGGENTR